MIEALVETYPALNALPGVRHGLVTRAPAIDVADERHVVLARLRDSHKNGREQLGLGELPLVTAEQVHGNQVAVVNQPCSGTIAAVDALVTRDSGICLGVYVADCCALYLVDPKARCAGLVHSGKRGTELGVVTAAIEMMQAALGAQPERMVAQISPCIRTPHYEVDFVSQIVRQCRASGIEHVHDCGINTASDLHRYYSYRAERGKTGRMLALIALV